MTALRRIGALDLPNLTPADLTRQALPMLEWIGDDDLLIDDRYQRSLTPAALRLIASLVERWDWMKFAPLIVAISEEGFEVIDGQNRATAAKLHPAIDTVPAYVFDKSTLPQRAEAFVSHVRDHVAVSRGQIHHAAITAGEPEAMAVDAVCRAAGVRILPFSPPFGVSFQIGDTVALASVRTMLARRGAEKTTEVLRALVAAGLAPISAQHIRAGEALLCEPEYATDFGVDQLTAALQAAGAGMSAEVRALAAAKGLPAWRAMVALLFKHRKVRPREAAPSATTGKSPVVQTDVTTPIALGECESTTDRTPEKGTYQAPVSSTARPLRDCDSIDAKAPLRRTVPVTASICGDPPPGRSALDQKKAMQQ